MSWRVLILVAVTAACGLVGCSAKQVEVGISSTANLNLNDFDEPLPVVVRIYQLADDTEFRKVAFNELWKDDLKALRDTLLTKEEIVMNPASQQTLEFPRHEQARFVGAMGVFRSPAEEQWRDLQPVADGFFARRFSSKITVRLKGSTLEIVD